MDALRARPSKGLRFYAADYRRQLRDAGVFRTLPHSDQVVLAALCDRANADGEAWPSVETIADQYNLGESTVRGALKRLAMRGLVLVLAGIKKTNLYQLRMPAGSTTTASSCKSTSSNQASPPRELAPNMANDHPKKNTKQHNTRMRAVASDFSSRDDGPPAGAELTKLPEDLYAELGRLNVRARWSLAVYGEARVRAALRMLHASRKPIGSAGAWLSTCLAQGWDEQGRQTPRDGDAAATARVAAAREQVAQVEATRQEFAKPEVSKASRLGFVKFQLDRARVRGLTPDLDQVLARNGVTRDEWEAYTSTPPAN